MSKHGRLPPYEPTNEDRELVAILAGNGIPHDIICRCIVSPATQEHIGINTLKRHFKPELTDGRAMADAGLIGRAYQMSKTVPAVLIFMLKTRLGWKEPAQDPNMRERYEDLVNKANEVPKLTGPALRVVNGGKSET